MEVLLANPRGFCAGVDRAVTVVDDLLKLVGPPVYVRHAIVHNRVVVDDLRARGAIFVEDIGDIPRGSLAVMSAHGVSRSVMAQAAERDLRVVDGTCPLVTKVQLEVVRHARAGRTVIVIGHRGHVEVDGLVGHYDGKAGGGTIVIETAQEAESLVIAPRTPLAYVTQTTLAVESTRQIIAVLRRRFPAIAEPHGETICYATQNRQDAVLRLATTCDLVIVVGAPHSSNSRRLVEVAVEQGVRSVLIETADELTPALFDGISRIGLTSSASAPEAVVQATIDWMRRHLPDIHVAETGEAENIVFRAPAALRALKKERSEMTDANHTTKDEGVFAQGLDDVLSAASKLATQLREAADGVARLGERELAMIIGTGEDVRDRIISSEQLAEARRGPIVAGLRKSAHRGLDLGFDAAAVGVQAGSDLLDTVLRNRADDTKLASA